MRSLSGPRIVQNNNINNNNNEDVLDNSMELLMRHSSPLDLTTIRPVTTTTTTTTTTPTVTFDGNIDTRSNVLLASLTLGGRSHNNRNNNSSSSPSPLRLNRPRSNPRQRTPNRATVEEEQQQQPPQQQQEEVMERRVLQRQHFVNNNYNTTTTSGHNMEGRRITIRPLAGAAVGTNMAGTRVSYKARMLT
jgi:hypothetical protein